MGSPAAPAPGRTPDALGSKAVRSAGLEEEGSPSGTSLSRVSHPLTLRETLVSVPASQVQILLPSQLSKARAGGESMWFSKFPSV